MLHKNESWLTRNTRKLLRSQVVETLTTPHGIDRYLEAMNPRWSVNEVKAEVVALSHPTADSVTLTLKPNALWNGFKPGQYVRLSVNINGVRRTRCYSPANSIHAADGLIELTAKAHAQGFVSKHLKQDLRVGSFVSLSQAEGVFALPERRPARVLLISGGSGITPVMSMLRTLCDEGHTGAITFLHYANRAQDQIYANELAQLTVRHPNVRVLRAYAQDSLGELSGYFSLEQLQKAVPDYQDAQTFLCGPAPMMNAVQQVWREAGLEARLHLEHFTAATPMVVDAANAEGEVRFVRSERLAINNGATLLDQAEAAGLRPESGCRMGICKACTCKKSAGQVRDIRTGELSDSGEEDIQICVSVPVGTVTLEL